MADKFTIELTTLAENQILKIAQYIRDEFKSPLSADRFIDKIVRVMAVVPYKMDQEKQLKKIDL